MSDNVIMFQVPLFNQLIGAIRAGNVEEITRIYFEMYPAEKPGSAETGGEKAELERRIVELSLKVWEYGAYIGDWEPIQAEIWRAEADEIEKELYGHITRLASLRGLKHKQFPTFPRTSQNQTVSSGAEGAHEGTTADKSEPKKLNNAQKSVALNCPAHGRGYQIACTCVALAESSLSSPPPDKETK